MLFKVLRRVCLLSWNIGQWRRKWEVDSILEPQLQSGFKQFWKLYLNLCSRKWLNSSRSRVINLIPLRLQQLKKLFGLGLINLRILFLKIPNFSELRRLESRLFYSHHYYLIHSSIICIARLIMYFYPVLMLSFGTASPTVSNMLPCRFKILSYFNLTQA